jgi:hypothetical protein
MGDPLASSAPASAVKISIRSNEGDREVVLLGADGAQSSKMTPRGWTWFSKGNDPATVHFGDEGEQFRTNTGGHDIDLGSGLREGAEGRNRVDGIS